MHETEYVVEQGCLAPFNPKSHLLTRRVFSVPLIRITMSPGCTTEQKSALVEELTLAFVRTCNGVRDRVTVVIEEVPKHHWGIGGEVVGTPPPIGAPE